MAVRNATCSVTLFGFVLFSCIKTSVTHLSPDAHPSPSPAAAGAQNVGGASLGGSGSSGTIIPSLPFSDAIPSPDTLPSNDWRRVLLTVPLNTPFDLAQTDKSYLPFVKLDLLTPLWKNSTAADKVTQVWISDGPEYLTESMFKDGKYEAVLADNIVQPGNIRLVVDHVNSIKKDITRRVLLAFENEASNKVTATLTFTRAAMSIYSQRVFQDFIQKNIFSPFSKESFTLSPGERTYFQLPTDMKYSSEVALMMLGEVKVSGAPIRIQSAVVEADTKEFVPQYYSANAFSGKKRLPLAHAPTIDHLRGVFNQSDREADVVKIDISNGVGKRISFDSDTNWIKGTDLTAKFVEDKTSHAVTRTPENAGNFGILHNVKLSITRSPGKPYNHVIVMIVPGGGNAAVLKVENNQVTDEVIPLYRKGGTKVMSMTILNQELKESQTVELNYKYSTAPMFSAPLHLVVLPLILKK